MKETWVPVVGYEGLYEVSDQGRVRSLNREVHDSLGRSRRVEGRVLRNIPSGNGYLQVGLYDHFGRRRVYVHHLVAEAFIGPRPEGQLVRHLNDDSDDCRLKNLAYGTPSQNVFDAIRNGRHHHASKTHCLRGHLLSGPNVYTSSTRVHRQCVSCHQAHLTVRRNRRYGLSLDVQTVADSIYRNAMAEKKSA